MRLAWRGSLPRGPSAAITYVGSRSQRRWDDGEWRPWTLDRRHSLRAQAEARAGAWRFFAAGDFWSGQPLTRVAAVVLPQPPSFPGDSIARLLPLYRYASEGSDRSAGGFVLNLGANGEFGGPWNSRIAVGFSILNVTVGRVAPEVAVPPWEWRGGPVSYRPLFSLPPIPSINARIEF